MANRKLYLPPSPQWVEDAVYEEVAAGRIRPDQAGEFALLVTTDAANRGDPEAVKSLGAVLMQGIRWLCGAR